MMVEMEKFELQLPHQFKRPTYGGQRPLAPMLAR